jgi:hypothetical protein
MTHQEKTLAEQHPERPAIGTARDRCAELGKAANRRRTGCRRDPASSTARRRHAKGIATCCTGITPTASTNDEFRMPFDFSIPPDPPYPNDFSTRLISPHRLIGVIRLNITRTDEDVGSTEFFAPTARMSASRDIRRSTCSSTRNSLMWQGLSPLDTPEKQVTRIDFSA